jgi:hypothetical protein
MVRHDTEFVARSWNEERCDLARFERALNHGSQAANEHSHRVAYYLSNREMRTLDEYAKSLNDMRAFA